MITYRLLALVYWGRFCHWVRREMVPACLHVIGAMLVIALVGAAVLRVLLSNLARYSEVMP